MKIRTTFLIRWLRTVDPNKNEQSVIDIEHVQSGDRWRVSSIEDATKMLETVSVGEIVLKQGLNQNLDIDPKLKY